MNSIQGNFVSSVFRALVAFGGTILAFHQSVDHSRAEPNPLCSSSVYDLDGSGLVTAADILALIDGMIGPKSESPRFDIDGSGEINEFDIDALIGQVTSCAAEHSPSGQAGGEVPIALGEPQITVVLTPSILGPYPPGASFLVVVSLQRAQATGLLRARLIQFDLALTHPDVHVSYPITHADTERGNITFWDYSSTFACFEDPAVCGFNYFIDGNGPLLNTTYVGFTTSASLQISVPTDTTLVPVGLLQVTLPEVLGVYRLDVMNAVSTNSNFGAEFRCGFGSLADPGNLIFRASTGQLGGGIIDLEVVSGLCTSGEPCFSDGNECTEDICIGEVCQHILKVIGASCGTQNGPCDRPICDGMGHCLPNMAPSGTVCRAAQSECDLTEFCTGQSVACPTNQMLPQGTPCEDDGAECTTDSCLAGSCVHFSRPTGTPCGNKDPLGECDSPDYCDGNGHCSPNLTIEGILCRAAAGECDLPDFCDGSSPHCVDITLIDGVSCADDADECTIDACDGAGNCGHEEIVGCREIPALSSWGLIVLTLLFAIGAKARFQRSSR